MGNKGNNRHMKSLNAPKYFGVYRKYTKYVVKPKAGRHTLDKSVPLSLFMKYKEFAKTTRDMKKIMSNNGVQVNGKPVHDLKYPLGLSDVITFKETPDAFVVGVENHGRASFTKVEKAQKERTYKIIRKYKTTKGKIIFGLHDGSIIPGSNDGKVNDSVEIGRKNTAAKILKFGKGAKCLVIDGVHVGNAGTIKDIKAGEHEGREDRY